MITNILTPQQMQDALARRGCSVDYQSLVMALSVCAHQGTHDRKNEWHPGLGQYWDPKDKDGKPAQEDHPYDADELQLRHDMESTLLRHVRRCYTANRWVLS